MDYEIKLDWLPDEYIPTTPWPESIEQAIADALLNWIVDKVSKSLSETRKWPWPKSSEATKQAIADALCDISEVELDEMVKTITRDKFNTNALIYTYIITERMKLKEAIPALQKCTKEDISIIKKRRV